MSNSDHSNHENISFYGVYHAIHSNTDTICAFCSYQFFHTCWIRIMCQLLNSLHNPRNGVSG